MRPPKLTLSALTLLAASVLIHCGSTETAGGASTTSGGGGHGGAGAGSSSSSSSSSSGVGGSSGDAGGTPFGGGGAGGAEPDASADATPPPPADAPGIACLDALADVYVTPANLPPMTAATRGDVVRCAKDTGLTAQGVASAVFLQGIGTSMKSGVAFYRIAFRTTRGDGSPGVSTARVYLPETQAELPLPVIVIGHPTTGLAAGCAPSLDPLSNQDLALPWAGLGYAVIVPDYAGLGNEGEAACNLDKLAKDGVTPVVCADVGGQHTTVVARNMDFALSWGVSLLNGTALPICSAAGMPACTP